MMGEVNSSSNPSLIGGATVAGASTSSHLYQVNWGKLPNFRAVFALFQTNS